MIDGKPSPFPANRQPVPLTEVIPPSTPPQEPAWPEEETPVWPGQEQIGWPGKRFDPDEYAAAHSLPPLKEKTLPPITDRPLLAAQLEKPADQPPDPSTTTVHNIGSLAAKPIMSKSQAEATPGPEKEPSREEKLLNPLRSRLRQLAAQLESRDDIHEYDVARNDRTVSDLRDFIEKTLPSTPENLEQLYKNGLDFAVESELIHNKFAAEVSPEDEKTDKSLFSNGGKTLVSTSEGIQLLNDYFEEVGRKKLFDTWIEVKNVEAIQGMSSNTLVDWLFDLKSSAEKVPSAFDQLNDLYAQQGVLATDRAFKKLRSARKETITNIAKTSTSEDIKELVAQVKDQLLEEYVTEIHAKIAKYEKKVRKGGLNPADVFIFDISSAALSHAGPRAINKVLASKGLIAPSEKDFKLEAKSTAQKGIEREMDNKLVEFERGLHRDRELSARDVFILQHRDRPEIQEVEQEVKRLKDAYQANRRAGDPDKINAKSLERKLMKRFHPDSSGERREVAQRQVDWITTVYGK
jgi:hypothetical protein